MPKAMATARSIATMTMAARRYVNGSVDVSPETIVAAMVIRRTGETTNTLVVDVAMISVINSALAATTFDAHVVSVKVFACLIEDT